MNAFKIYDYLVGLFEKKPEEKPEPTFTEEEIDRLIEFIETLPFEMAHNRINTKSSKPVSIWIWSADYDSTILVDGLNINSKLTESQFKRIYAAYYAKRKVLDEEYRLRKEQELKNIKSFLGRLNS